MDEPQAPRTHIDRGGAGWRFVWRVSYVLARRWGRLVRLLVFLRVPSFDNEVVQLALIGRRTGRPRPIFVTLIRVRGEWYVGHPNGPRPWLANLAAADSVMITLPRQEAVPVRPIALTLGPERDAVIEATGFQQVSPVRPLYRAARGHILRAGIYYRLEPLSPERAAAVPGSRSGRQSRRRSASGSAGRPTKSQG